MAQPSLLASLRARLRSLRSATPSTPSPIAPMDRPIPWYPKDPSPSPVVIWMDIEAPLAWIALTRAAQNKN